MENWKQTTIVGLVAIIAVLCVFQAGCGGKSRAPECATCDCNDEVRGAAEGVAAQNKVLAGDLETLKKQSEAGIQCLVREEGARKAKELEKKAESEACDAHLVDSGWMESACSFDPRKASPFRTMTTEEELSARYSHSLEYRNYEYYLENALDCPAEKSWSKYTRTQVQARYDCLRAQYHKAHKDVVLYTKPLGMHFAAFGEEDYGYEPALRVVLDIMRDIDREQGVNLDDFGVTATKLVAAYQFRFKEALEFYEARVRVCEDGKDTFHDRDGVLGGQLCDLVTDFNLYAAYPDPLKGVTRAEMAKRLKCEEE